MKSKEIVENLVLIGGLLIAGKAGTDLAANKALQREFQQESRITEQLSEKYGVKTVCGAGYCADEVSGSYSQAERRNILDEYYAAQTRAINAIPRDPVADRMGLIDSGLVVGGLAVAASGVAKKVRK